MSAPYYADGPVTVYAGDCIDVMRELPDASVDAVVTDPPYSLEFMGREWDKHEDEDAAFGYYLAGLIDGEGHFRVDAKARRCEFALKMRDDDEWILRRAMAFVGHGRITHEARIGPSNPVATLVIDTKDGVGALCSLLMRYPLRAKKLRDFIVWAEAVDEWLTMERGNRWHGATDRARLRVLGERIREGRNYSEVAWSGNGFQDWCRQWATEALRVLKPGGHLLAFGGTRTFHRLTAGIEDAGFEIRDSIAWMYGSGFPKSLDVSKAIDKAAGADRQDVYDGREPVTTNTVLGHGLGLGLVERRPVTQAAQDWQGWGTALKPAFEPIVVARKPLTGTVAANVLAHGTGALNIDGCRTGTQADMPSKSGLTRAAKGDFLGVGETVYERHHAGRWPANVVLDESQAAALDAQAGPVGSNSGKPTRADGTRNAQGLYSPGTTGTEQQWETRTGGAARFFYTAKASQEERPNVDGIAHPTVKPVDLMRWLVRLVTPKGGTVLEPFAGSGTTVEACVLEGFNCIAIEREATYLPLIEKRIRKPHHVGLDLGDWDGAA